MTDSTTDAPRLTLDLETFIETIKLGELVKLEKAVKLNTSEILRAFEKNDYSAELLVGIVWIALRRDNPKATMKAAGEIELAQIADAGDDEDEEDEEESGPT